MKRNVFQRTAQSLKEWFFGTDGPQPVSSTSEFSGEYDDKPSAFSLYSLFQCEPKWAIEYSSSTNSAIQGMPLFALYSAPAAKAYFHFATMLNCLKLREGFCLVINPHGDGFDESYVATLLVNEHLRDVVTSWWAAYVARNPLFQETFIPQITPGTAIAGTTIIAGEVHIKQSHVQGTAKAKALGNPIISKSSRKFGFVPSIEIFNEWCWIIDNCSGDVMGVDNCWLMQNTADAVLFKLS